MEDTLFTDDEIIAATPTDAERADTAEKEFSRLNNYLKENHPSIYIKYWKIPKSIVDIGIKNLGKNVCGVTHDA